MRPLPHHPERPSWDCDRGCGPWPCEMAKGELIVEYDWHAAVLGIYMSSMATAAAPDLGDSVTAGKLYRRFIGWVGDRSRAPL